MLHWTRWVMTTVNGGVFSNFPWCKFATISTALIATLFLLANDLFHAARWFVLRALSLNTVGFAGNPFYSIRTSPWSSGKCARFGAGRSGVRLSAGSYQDLVNWYCSLLTRRTVCGRAAGNTLRTQNRSKRNEIEIVQTQSWRYKNLVVIKCQQQTTITNKLFDTRSAALSPYCQLV